LPSLQAWDTGLDTTFTRALEKEPRTHRDATRALAAEYARRATLLVGVLRRVWDRRMGDPAPTPGKARTPGDEWIDVAQEFVAISVVLSVAYKCEQLRNLGVFVLSSALLVLLANTSYSFQPQQLFTMLAATTVVGAIGILLWVFIQMERDELLNRAGGTSGGRMTLDGPFVAKIVTMVGLPLATLIASQVPQVGRFLGSLLAAAR
jgi:hypothetical protein